MVRKYKPAGLKKYEKHNPAILKQAVDDVENKKLTLREAATKYGIHFSVIYRHYKKGDAIKPQGGQTCLTTRDEQLLVERLKICSDWGSPIDTWSLRLLVKEYLNKHKRKVSQFKNNLPGRDFVSSFVKRHKKELSFRMCQNIKRKRAAVSHDDINQYFDKLSIELQDVPPSNIVNFDETNLCDDPGRKQVITKRGCKYPERVINSTKASISVMFSAAANGTILPPYVVYKAVHLYSTWTENGPKNARYNRSKTGWFDSSSFEDWLTTTAVPYLKKQSGKRVLIGDNLSSHLTLKVIDICTKNNIDLIFLPPNSTHLTQPLDVAFFRPLKTAWRKILEKCKTGPGTYEASLPKDRFPRLLNQLMQEIGRKGPANVRAGFRKCGIVPIDRKPVLEMLPSVPDQNEVRDDCQKLDDSLVSLLKETRYGQAPTREKRKKIAVQPGQSVTGHYNDDSNHPQPEEDAQETDQPQPEEVGEETDQPQPEDDQEMPNVETVPDVIPCKNLKTYPFLKFTYKKNV